MIELPDFIKESIDKGNGKIEFKGLISKTAVIKGIGKTYEDVLGWNIVFRNDGKCYEFYCAQFPLIGCTHAQECHCLLGIRAFDSYKVDFKQALEKRNQLNCGDKFVGLKLYWPLAPGCDEPHWYIRTNLGSQIVVGANSGKVIECHKSK
jgi:hypothetical protein